MPLYLNYRTPFGNFTSKITKKLDSDSIIDWFKTVWRLDLNGEELYHFFLQKFQTHFYGLGHLAYNIAEKKIQEPTSVEELEKTLKENSYINEIRIENGKYLEILTDDDEFSLAWYILEEKFARTNLNRFAYLIYEDWRLPLDYNPKKGTKINFKFEDVIRSNNPKSGELYFISIINDSGEGPIAHCPLKIEGIRLPDFKEFLTNEDIDFEVLPVNLIYYAIKFKEQEEVNDKKLIDEIEVFKNTIPDLHKLFHFYIDFESDDLYLGLEKAKEVFRNAFENLSKKAQEFKEIGREDINKIDEIHIHGNNHLIQMSIQADYWENHPVDSDLKKSKVFDQVFIFDDLWVTENEQLANSILHYYSNWKL
ncbi:MAG: hypothetical protein AAGG68_21375 [Bacteroidota bacterium]